MAERRIRIGIVAPSSPIKDEIAERVREVARRMFRDDPPELYFHPQCFLRHNHFAGTDAARAEAFLEIANDPSFDALWFARGGYGACRIAAEVIAKLAPVAVEKTYLGYSDAGTLLGALHNAECGATHGPMCQDILREGGEAAIERALRWLVDYDEQALEPNLSEETPSAAFNLTVLSQIIGTPLQPDLTGHVLMLEEVSEHLYRIDRSFHHITANPDIRKVAGIRLGRCGDIPDNDVDFGMTPEAIAAHWCEISGIPYLGRADIGHDAANKVVPFG